MNTLQQTVWMFMLVVTFRATQGSIGCKDMNGNDVDWFYVYKVPKDKYSSVPSIQKGLAFYYLDINQQTFQLSNVFLSDKDHCIAHTLNQIYNEEDQVRSKPFGVDGGEQGFRNHSIDIRACTGRIASVMYNDEWPNGKKVGNRGHTKGVVAFDSSRGFWLIHSVPKFPSNSSYSWPSNAVDYGQSMLCVTYKSSSMEDIAKQMQYTYPSVYSYNLPSDLLDLAPTFKDVVSGHHVKGPNWTSKVTLYSRQGQSFVHYAKFTNFNADLYVDFVAPDMKSNLETETWRNGQGALPSNCSTAFDVKNIQEMSFPEADFKSTKDHSKLAIADASLQMICVGDINRAVHQFDRGGGTLCTKLPSVWKQYNDLVKKVENCP